MIKKNDKDAIIDLLKNTLIKVHDKLIHGIYVEKKYYKSKLELIDYIEHTLNDVTF